ncbi:hypothetical protein BSLG_001923 [Batrachochytrium salamandrivorans]|nr:hypothetical protein BSLG_001923 [Batrachochytrium salamandrivorans]
MPGLPRLEYPAALTEVMGLPSPFESPPYDVAILPVLGPPMVNGLGSASSHTTPRATIRVGGLNIPPNFEQADEVANSSTI